MFKWKASIGVIGALFLVCITFPGAIKSEEIIRSLQRLHLKGPLLAGNIGQLIEGMGYYLDINLGEPSTYGKTLFSKGEPRILGTWKIYTGIMSNSPTTLGTGIVDCRVGSKNELLINIQKGISNGKTILILSKPNFELKDFIGTGLLFVRQGKQTPYYYEAQEIFKKMTQSSQGYSFFQTLLERLKSPGRVGIFENIDEEFFKSIRGLGGLDLVLLAGQSS